MSLSAISVTNTFLEWMLRTNDTITRLNAFESGDGSYRVANTAISGNLFNFVSNTTQLVIEQPSPQIGNTIYIGIGTLSTSPDDTAIANIASANVVNVIHQLARTIFANANLALATAEGAYAQANVDSGIAPYNQANTAYNQANTAYARANSAFLNDANTLITAQGAFLQANSAWTEAVAANTTARAAFTNANSVLITASAAFNNANSTLVTASSAFGNANSTLVTASAAFAKANTACTEALAANTTARSAFDKANSGTLTAQGAFLKANNANITAVGAFSNANSTLVTASAAFAQANTGLTTAQGAFAKANTGIAGNTANQVATGGTSLTPFSHGVKSTGTFTPYPGTAGMMYYFNNGAHTLAPGSQYGTYLLDIKNNSSAGAITTSGWTFVAGDDFDTTANNIFRCHCSISQFGSLLVIQAMQ